MAIFDQSYGLDPCPNDHELQNLGRRFDGNHNPDFGFSQIYFWEEMVFLDLIHFLLYGYIDPILGS